MLYICQTAVDLLADSSKFPDDWLFNHRWGKGKKDAPTTLPNGAKITHLTVGGRTSCVVPSVQKKTGAVAGDLKKEEKEELEAEEGTEVSEESKGAKGKGPASRKRKTVAKSEPGPDQQENAPLLATNRPKKPKPNPRTKANIQGTKKEVKEEVNESQDAEVLQNGTRGKSKSVLSAQNTEKTEGGHTKPASQVRRRSGRLPK